MAPRSRAAIAAEDCKAGEFEIWMFRVSRALREFRELRV